MDKERVPGGPERGVSSRGEEGIRIGRQGCAFDRRGEVLGKRLSPDDGFCERLGEVIPIGDDHEAGLALRCVPEDHMVSAVVRHSYFEPRRIVEKEPAYRVDIALESWTLRRGVCESGWIG